MAPEQGAAAAGAHEPLTVDLHAQAGLLLLQSSVQSLYSSADGAPAEPLPASPHPGRAPPIEAAFHGEQLRAVTCPLLGAMGPSLPDPPVQHPRPLLKCLSVTHCGCRKGPF